MEAKETCAKWVMKPMLVLHFWAGTKQNQYRQLFYFFGIVLIPALLV